MKIGMVLDHAFPPDPRVENEAITLIDKGHEVFLFCLSYGVEKRYENYKGIKVVRFKSNKLEYKFSALTYTVPFYSFLMKGKLQSFIKTINPDVLHVHDIRVAEAVFLINKKYNLPVVLDLHDNIPENMKFYPHLQKFPGKYIINPEKWKIKEEEFIRKSDRVITVSPEFIQDVVRRVPSSKSKISLVPNTVLTSFYKDKAIDSTILDRYKNHFTLLYLGDTHLRRGLLTAVRSIPILKETINNLKLVIVGKNTTDAVLKKEVKFLGVEEYVDFEGWQNVKLFPSYIEATNIGISPLHRNVQHDMAYPNKLFQYMSLGKPVLVSNALAQKKIVEENKTGLVHIEQNPQDFADKVLQLYNNPDLSTTFGENGKRFIEEKFSWEQTSKELVKLYDKLLD